MAFGHACVLRAVGEFCKLAAARAASGYPFDRRGAWDVDAERYRLGAFDHAQTPSPHSQQTISGGASPRAILVSLIAGGSCFG
jgi:hypothetical protein